MFTVSQTKHFVMKQFLFSLSTILLVSCQTFAQINPIIRNRKVQVAILFDTSNSMDGLIDQAKSRIWNIVNELSALRYQGQVPVIEIALYDYGNSGLSTESNYVRQQVSLTTDLDLISEKLFALSTNGGNEYCGAVIQKSMQDLNWSTNSLDLKMIYIAGNEPFNQGSIAYKEVCSAAAIRSIFVNTIYCGNYDQGIREFWKDCAIIAKGDYFNIDSDKAIVQVSTPFDDSINHYNDSLNNTYFGYGTLGDSKKSNQLAQDVNAEVQSISSKTERAIVKSKTAYSNESWDIIDAVDKGSKDITKMEDAELPLEFKGKTDEQKTQLIEAKKNERLVYQTKIAELAIDRQNFILEKTKSQTSEKLDDFGTSVNESILKKATEIGYNKE
jgi:hypothetical protein